jgi:SNF2 family DNA or RNA helicase
MLCNVRIVDGRSDDRKQGPTLVVTPASVVTQWAEEIKRMAPGLLVEMYMGPARTTGRPCLAAPSRPC